MRRISALAVLAACVLAGCGSASSQSATGSVHPAGWGTPPPATFGLAPQTSGPTAVMYDSVTLSTVPARPFAQAGYTAGRWPTYLPMRRAWPAAHTISIAISAADHADCLDIEPGDAVPSQAPAWVRADIRAGFHKPCVYSSYFEFVDQVRPALAAAHIARSAVFEWDADYTGRPGITPGFDATQWTDRCLGRNLDCSTVSLAFLTVAQPPYVTPRPRRVQAVCFHRRESEARCAAAHAQIASDQRAAEASARVLADARLELAANGCERPYRRGVCVRDGRTVRVMRQRERWFTAHAASIEAAN